MKPRNFPGRKNKRRIAALTRGVKNEKHRRDTEAKITDQTEARKIRTKKRR